MISGGHAGAKGVCNERSMHLCLVLGPGRVGCMSGWWVGELEPGSGWAKTRHYQSAERY
jgi:hypothetical protein